MEEGDGFEGEEGGEGLLVAEGEEGVVGCDEEGGEGVVVDVGHYGGLLRVLVKGLPWGRGGGESCMVEGAENSDFFFDVMRCGGRCCCF